MRSRTAVVLAALALAVPSASAGEAPKKAAPLTPEAVARLYLSDQPGDQTRAEGALDAATPAFLREVLDEVRSASDDFRIAPNRRIPPALLQEGVGADINLRWITLTPEQVAAAVPDGDREIGTSRLRILESGDLARLLELARTDPEARELSPGRITTLNRLKTLSSVRNKVSYLADHEVKLGDGGERIDFPIMGSAEDGADIVVTPRVSIDRARIALDVKTRIRRMIRPIAREDVPLPGGAADVERPEIGESRWSRTASVPDGGTVLIFMPDGYGPTGLRLMLLVTAKIVDLNAPPRPPESPTMDSAPVAPK